MSDTVKKIKFRTYSGSTIHDEVHSQDYRDSTSYKNKIFVGKKGIYHRDLFKKHFIPYEDIRCVYKQVQIIPVDDSPPYEQYRIIFEGDHGVITEILFGESFMNRAADNDLAEALLRDIGSHGSIQIGYDESRPLQKKSIWHR